MVGERLRTAPACALLAWLAGASPASAEGAKQACIDANEEAQVAERAGRFREAKSHLVACASPSCPALVRVDCARLLTEISGLQPTVLIDARDDSGSETTDVRMYADGVLVESAGNGLEVELDPGAHTLRFEMKGEVREVRVVLKEGEKRRHIVADFTVAPFRSPTPRPPTASAATRTTAVTPNRLPWLFAGIGAAAALSFGGFAVAGYAGERQLATTCSPKCRPEELTPIKREYLIADVSLAVTVVSLRGGGDPRLGGARPRRRPHSHARRAMRTLSRRHRWMGGIALVGVAIEACSLRPLDYLTRESAAEGDAGGDAGGAVDGAPVATEAGPAARFCDSYQGILCDDFDSDPVGSKWSPGFVTRGTGTLDAGPGAFVSAPRSLVAHSPDGEAAGWNELVHVLGSTPNHMVADLALQIVERSSETDLSLLVVSIGYDGPAEYEVELLATATGDPAGSLKAVEAKKGADGGETYQYLLFDAPAAIPAVGSWMHLTFDVTFAPNPMLRVSLGDAGTPALEASLSPSLTAGKRTVELGLAYYTSGGWTVRFDDVGLRTPSP
jgi:hypothetical protein